MHIINIILTIAFSAALARFSLYRLAESEPIVNALLACKLRSACRSEVRVQTLDNYGIVIAQEVHTLLTTPTLRRNF